MSELKTNREFMFLALNNADKIQASVDRMMDRRPIQIDGVQFVMMTRMRLTGDQNAVGVVLVARRKGEDWQLAQA